MNIFSIFKKNNFKKTEETNFDADYFIESLRIKEIIKSDGRKEYYPQRLYYDNNWSDITMTNLYKLSIEERAFCNYYCKESLDDAKKVIELYKKNKLIVHLENKKYIEEQKLIIKTNYIEV